MEKRSVKAYAAAGTVLVLAALFSFGFPGLLFRWQDERLEGQLGQEKAAKVVITEQPELTILEKVHLAGRESSYFMMLVKGRNYSQETIAEKAGQELAELGERGILNKTEEKVEAHNMSAYFIMDVEGENSVILWQGQVYTDNGREFELVLDDETGKILSMNCYDGMELKSDEAENIAYSWGEYLGCHVASVSEEEITENIVSDGKEEKKFENEVQMQMEGGIPETEARARVREEWGLPDPGFSVRACYGDENGSEAVYQIEFIPSFGGSLSIMAE